jgi:hypothetical protein
MPSSPSNGFIKPTRNLTCFLKRYLDLKKIEAEVVSACRLTFLLVEGGDHLFFRLFHYEEKPVWQQVALGCKIFWVHFD